MNKTALWILFSFGFYSFSLSDAENKRKKIALMTDMFKTIINVHSHKSCKQGTYKTLITLFFLAAMWTIAIQISKIALKMKWIHCFFELKCSEWKSAQLNWMESADLLSIVHNAMLFMFSHRIQCTVQHCSHRASQWMHIKCSAEIDDTAMHAEWKRQVTE